MRERFVRPFGFLQRTLQHSPPELRRVAAMLVDAAIVMESFAVALIFRFNGDIDPSWWITFWPSAILSAVIFVALLYESGIYQSILRYTGIYQGIRVASATSIAAGIIFILDVGHGRDAS